MVVASKATIITSKAMSDGTTVHTVSFYFRSTKRLGSRNIYTTFSLSQVESPNPFGKQAPTFCLSNGIPHGMWKNVGLHISRKFPAYFTAPHPPCILLHYICGYCLFFLSPVLPTWVSMCFIFWCHTISLAVSGALMQATNLYQNYIQALSLNQKI